MRGLRLLVVLLLVAVPVTAQSPSYGCCGFRDWATYGAGDPLRWHPSADLLGGAAMVLVARGPWFSDGVRRHRLARLAVVAVGAGFWQYQNKKEIAGYRWDYVAFDFTWTVASAALVDLVLGNPR
ncbi:MAG: hypothetical protein IPK12_23510 [Gemmatimonadetes bacterium]|nr:hypothetical protein [Gemmatimonadota bacterium]